MNYIIIVFFDWITNMSELKPVLARPSQDLHLGKEAELIALQQKLWTYQKMPPRGNTNKFKTIMK